MQYLLNDSEKTKLKLALDGVESENNRLKRHISITTDNALKTTGMAAVKKIAAQIEEIKKMKIL
jgi:seryl-tRNA synthetase